MTPKPKDTLSPASPSLNVTPVCFGHGRLFLYKALKRMDEMKNFRSTVVAVLTLLAFVSGSLLASVPAVGADTATISGKVVDASTGLGLPGVRIESYGATAATATSDQAGSFSLRGLQGGQYTLILSLTGY